MRALAPLVSSLTGPTALVLALIGCAPPAVHRVRELPVPLMHELSLQPVSLACEPGVWEEAAPWGTAEISVMQSGALLLVGRSDVEVRERTSGKLLGKASPCPSIIGTHIIDERTVFVVCHDQGLHLNVPNMNARLLYEQERVTIAAFGASAVALGVGSYPDVTLRSLRSGASLGKISHTIHELGGLALSADDRLLAIGGMGEVEVVTLSTRKRTRFPTAGFKWPRPLRFAFNARVLVVQTDRPRSYEWRTGNEVTSAAPPERSAAPGCHLSGTVPPRVSCQVDCPQEQK